MSRSQSQPNSEIHRPGTVGKQKPDDEPAFCVAIGCIPSVLRLYVDPDLSGQSKARPCNLQVRSFSTNAIGRKVKSWATNQAFAFGAFRDATVIPAR
jgi:hypothetical protein